MGHNRCWQSGRKKRKKEGKKEEKREGKGEDVKENILSIKIGKEYFQLQK